MISAVRTAFLTLVLAAGALARAVAAGESSPAAIDRYASAFEAKAAAHRADAVYANFAGNGERYVRYTSERSLGRALESFLHGPAPGGGSFVARIYHVAGSKGLYVTFDPAVQTSLAVRERVLFDGSSHAIRLQIELQSYNGYFRTVRTAYFAGGRTLSDTTVRSNYAPSDMSFSHPLTSRPATLDQDEILIPVYETRAELPFAA